MARKLFERQAIRRRTGALATGVVMVVYTDAAGTLLADISTSSGGSAIAGSTVTTANIAGFGPAALQFWGPTDGTDTLYIRVPSDTSLGVQEIEAATDPRLDALEAGSGGAHPDLAVHNTLGLATQAELDAAEDALEAVDQKAHRAVLAPPSIAGLVGWFDASQITGLSDGASVTSWADSSGNGNIATQATGANQPTYQTAELNSRPVVRFDGTNDCLRVDSLAATFTGTDEAFSVVAVLKPTDQGGNYAYFGVASDSTGTPFVYCTASSGAYQTNKRDDASSSASAASAGGAADAAWHVVATVAPGTTVGTWEDGTAVVAAGTALDVGATTLDIAAIADIPLDGTVTTTFKGDIAELLVFNRALTTAERQQLDWWLGLKYALTVTTTGFVPADVLPTVGPYSGIADPSRIVVREPLTQAIIDAHAATDRALHLDAGIHTVPIALSVPQGFPIIGEDSDHMGAGGGTRLVGATGQDIFVLPDATSSGWHFRNLKFVGGRRHISSTPTDYHTYIDILDCEFSGSSLENVYLTGAHEELRIGRCGFNGGTYGLRVVDVGGGGGGRYLDRSRIFDCVFGGFTENAVRLETLLANSIVFDVCTFATADKHGVVIDGGFRAVEFRTCNWEGNGEAGKMWKATGTTTGASTSLTSVTTGTGTAPVNGDSLVVAGAGAAGVDHFTTISSGAGTSTIVMADAAVTAVTAAAVSNAIYDDLFFDNTIATPSNILLTSCLIGAPAATGHLRYAMRCPSSGFIHLINSSGDGTIPVYDPGKICRVVGGQTTLRRPGYANTLGEDIWPAGTGPTVTGSRGGNAALASLLAELAKRGLITDSSS